MSNLRCRGCQSFNVQMFLDLGEQPHCNRLVSPTAKESSDPKYPLRVHFCHDCTLVQIDHTIPKESMFSDYPYISGTTSTLVNHFRETADRLVHQYEIQQGSLVVDIGSNDGTWLKQYSKFGLRLLGIDPASNVVALALADGVPTWPRFFNEATASEILVKEGQPSLITAAGVFFHLEELQSVIRGIKLLLDDDAVFVVQAIYLGQMLDNTAFDQIYHEHLVYYTLKSLTALLEPFGLEIFDARLVPIHGGTLEAHVARKGTRQIMNSVRELEADEALKGYGKFATYEAFVGRVDALKRDLLDMLKGYKSAGRTVYALGAPAKGATLLNSFGIGPDLVQKATERNPMKIGLLIPGCRIPIVDESGPDPDAYLVLAWNFIDEIAGRHGAYFQKGGEFIVPIPNLHVIRR